MIIGEFKKILWDITILWQCIIFDQRMPMGLNISPSIWQSYINSILDCLQSRKYCKAIIDDLFIIHSIKEITHSKIRSTKSFIKEWT